MIMRQLRNVVLGSSVQRCPECDAQIGFDSINMKEGVAACTACRKLFRISELNWSYRSREEVLEKTPMGCSLVPWGQSLILHVSNRSIPTFLGLLFACLFWNGIVSVFVSIAVAGLWANLIGPIPNWLPVPGGMQQGKPVMNDEPMNLGMTLFLCLFMLPFVVIGIGLLVGALMAIFGRVRVVIDQVDSYVSSGMGLLSWKQRFDASSIEAVRYYNNRGDGESAARTSIQLIGDRTIEFGSALPEDRRQWLAVNLQAIFAQEDQSLSNRLPRDYPIPSWLESAKNRK